MVDNRQNLSRKRSIGVVILSLVATNMMIGSCSDEITYPDFPTIHSVEPATSEVGDTVIISGRDLDSGLEGFSVAFSASGFKGIRSFRTSMPFDVAADQMKVVVPDGSFSGQLRIQWDNPFGISGPFDQNLPPAPGDLLDFSVDQKSGEVAKVFYSGSQLEFCLGSSETASDYILILFSGADPVSPSTYYSYMVNNGIETIHGSGALERSHAALSGSVVASGSTALSGSAGGSGSDGRHDTAELRFEKKRRDEIREAIGRERIQKNEPGDRQSDSSVLQTRVFNVYSDIDGSTIAPASFTEVTADLKYEGTHTLLYVDQLTAPACITDAEAQWLGDAFESGIYQTDRTAFGDESDINGDGKVVILLSPVINRLTEQGTASTEGFIAGFFLPGDLIPSYLDHRCTNGMEICYTMVPDPGGLYGNTYEKSRALEVIRGVIAHEFMHMIMFNYRILQYGGGIYATYSAETWVNEGLAHIAEDLNNHEESNIGRANIFLEDPGDVSLIHGGDALDERGAAFLFFRYLGDRFGEQVYRDIVQTKAVGVDNIERVTGLDFYELFADWSAAVYLDGLEISSDERFSYSSIDLRSDFEPLAVKFFDHNLWGLFGALKSMGPEYIRISLPLESECVFIISSDPGSRMNVIIIRTDDYQAARKRVCRE
ncbi:MAG: IPT/TIG domain-containing protein [Candidatus Krumholzibacteria bacterium]|nr:IPT/TIG domain-containing protein [Candidatus Krumholzibacteria bacterium]